jgi:predicted TIM-barrel fold metal-dependent hydrolase
MPPKSGKRKAAKAKPVGALPLSAKPAPMVDVHCHVFSGRDIPLKQFLHYGRGLPWGLASLVESLIRHPMLPTAENKEKAKLFAMADGAHQSDFQEAEDRGILERFFAYADLMARSVESIANVMLDTYPCDLFTPAMVDMDCWLGDATFYDSRVEDHAALALQKKKDKRGKMLPLIGFDPVRQFATRQAFGDGKDHLAQVRKAIETQGFVGVKVYPPMGFRPTRNAWAYPPGTTVLRPDKTPVRCRLREDEPSQPVSLGGADLDTAMHQLFEYCIAEDVPVMAHCTSHGAESAKFRGYNSDPRHWRELLTMDGGRFEELRLNLSHLGGDTQRPGFADEAIRVVAEFPNVYSDVGAHHLVWEDPPARGVSWAYELMSALEERRDWTRSLMLGSDWHTIFVEASPGIYLRNYLAFYDALSGDIDTRAAVVGFPLSSDDDATRRESFRGRAALRFLGLDEAAPGKNRARVEKFYKDNGIFTMTGADKPAWW